MLWAFLAPTFASGPDGVPVAVAGPGPVVEKLIAQAEQQEEHPDFITVSSPEEAETMVRDREAVGAIAIGEGGARGTLGAGAPTNPRTAASKAWSACASCATTLTPVCVRLSTS